MYAFVWKKEFRNEPIYPRLACLWFYSNSALTKSAHAIPVFIPFMEEEMCLRFFPALNLVSFSHKFYFKMYENYYSRFILIITLLHYAQACYVFQG